MRFDYRIGKDSILYQFFMPSLSKTRVIWHNIIRESIHCKALLLSESIHSKSLPNKESIHLNSLGYCFHKTRFNSILL